jgi:hypothetical protein
MTGPKGKADTSAVRRLSRHRSRKMLPQIIREEVTKALSGRG